MSTEPSYDAALVDNAEPRLLRLLLVDDSEAVHATLRALLRRHERSTPTGPPRVSLDWVSDHDDAARELRALRHDCYLIDYQIGTADGIDLIRAARHDGVLAPIITLTGTDALEHEAAEAGANDYLVKGDFTAPMLLRSVRYAMTNAEALRRLALANTSLEDQVAHRTRELTEANARLREEMAARTRLESALASAEKLEALGRMTGTVAHDFNNMLTALKGSLELLERRLADRTDRRIQGPLATANAATQRAETMVAGLLAFARRKPLASRPLDLNRLLSEAQELLRLALGGQVELRLELAPHVSPVFGDEDQFQRAIVNLAANARDVFAGGSGQLRISTSAAEPPPAALRPLLAGPTYVRVAVRDNGPGMPPDVLRRAFEPLFTTKAEGHGTGLGLAQVYGFAQQSGGAAEIESAPGRGTCVTLYLPPAEVAAA